MVARKGLIFIGIVFGCMPCLFGKDGNVAAHKTNSVSAAPEKMNERITGDIERPLLRPIVYKKEEANVNSNNQKTEESHSSSRKEDGVEGLLSLLRAEREKLQTLENQYKKIGNNMLVEADGDKNKEGNVDKMTEPPSTDSGSDTSQSGDGQIKIGVSAEIPSGDSMKEAGRGVGSSTAQLLVMKSSKKSESNTNSTLPQRLEAFIKNVSQLDVAECYYKLCEFDNALRMYQLLTPNNAPLDQYIWAQYQIANCYRNMKKYDTALSEYQKFVNQFPESTLIDQAKWYMEDVNWWKGWNEKNTLTNNQLLAASNSRLSE